MTVNKTGRFVIVLNVLFAMCHSSVTAIEAETYRTTVLRLLDSFEKIIRENCSPSSIDISPLQQTMSIQTVKCKADQVAQHYYLKIRECGSMEIKETRTKLIAAIEEYFKTVNNDPAVCKDTGHMMPGALQKDLDYMKKWN